MTEQGEPEGQRRLWCGVLGPLRVRAAGTDVPLHGRRQQALVATLALRYPAAVPPRTLAHRVWPERYPPDPDGLRVLVHRVRARLRAVHPDAAAGLRHTVDGYQLDLGSGGTDLADLRELRDRAHRAEAAGDLATAVALVDRATDLVRGAPCQGVWSDPGRWPELVPVSEEVQALRRMSLDVRLRLGDHLSVLPELAVLAAREPTAEWVHDLRLRALARAGRYDEAVTAYRTFRRRVVDDLGVEPSTVITRTYRRILDHDDDPAAGVAPPAPRGRTTTSLTLHRAGAWIADRGDYRQASHCFTASLDLDGDPLSRAEALLRLGEIRYHQTGGGLDELSRAATLFRRAGRWHQAAEALSWQARSLWLRPGEGGSAVRRTAEVLDLLDERAPDAAGAAALVNVCGILAVSDQDVQARRAGRLGLRWARQLSLTPLDLRARGNLALVDLGSGHEGVTAELDRVTQAYQDRVGWVPPVLWVALADAEDRRGRLGAAAAYRERALGRVRGTAATADVPWLVAEQVREAFHRGRWAEARAAGDRYLRGDDRDHRMASEVHVVLARLALHRHDLPGAHRHSSEAEVVARRDGGAALLGPALVQRLRVAVALRRPRTRVAPVVEELLDCVAGRALTSSFGVDLPLALRESGVDGRTLTRHAPADSPWLSAADAVLTGDPARARRIYLAVGSRGDARQLATAASG
ncbi:AfsR/SARP family transcriptional regulator [Micromonospora humi]|uniref:DNA-binding transcriptional activator of the SARP family n=1 Tax=Micromonospora humi TaxID=745366 RepID=A0A1C5JPX0_9ACTN|nr:AfsR/SARP family transcriptional regulator [Micromonospora humi]SCG72533.1 DNA-binding transcriptional activator of the SARP family [Micromonospora humi]